MAEVVPNPLVINIFHSDAALLIRALQYYGTHRGTIEERQKAFELIAKLQHSMRSR